ncbi:MAG: hypothetical protein LBV10_19775 [Stenotrophomonas sp.]|jgi:hypothetical protein|uniref:hypothetical protein n=1 Tax=Stenotrophomonas sp. TaxID=69392 RepID=UPI00284F1753|nr:hypothetical protein [Stenotrophomonas sp.]MDR2961766.1 hypothetical protein [Stenotrophomonas sp.]
MDRRQFLASLAIAAATRALPSGTAPAGPGEDWRWLQGNWRVRHQRLKERLVGDTRWESFAGSSAVWLTLGGRGTIDDNVMALPSGAYRGLGVRAFDPVSSTWSIWWIDGRNPGRIEPPVRGRFDANGGTFHGTDRLDGRPIDVRFRWHDIHGKEPWWEQAFSADGGMHWEINWRNWFRRTAAAPAPLSTLPDAPADFDFLVGHWNVHHRRLRARLVGSDAWEHFNGTLHNWPVLGGYGNVGDNLMDVPAAPVRGMGIRAWNARRRHWLSWWLDGRAPTRIGTPLRGAFERGVGRFFGEDQHNGHAVQTRVVWSRITPRSARWEQAASIDGGRSWETNWVSDFERQA